MNKQRSKLTPNTLDQSQYTSYSEPKPKTVIQRATQLVDSVTNMLCTFITEGSMYFSQQQKPLQLIKKYENQSKINIQIKTIDIDEHKRMVKRFMLQNKSLRKKRQIRSYQLSQKSLRLQKSREQSKFNQRSQIIQERKRVIQKRMEAKKSFLSQLRKSTIETNQKVKMVRKRKFLHQDKQEQFYKNYVLPKLQEQRKLLEKKKQLRLPMNLSQISEHQRQYQQLRMNQQLNRSITRKMLEDQKQYSPPPFVPNSYRISQRQQKLKRQQEYLKKRQSQINQIRKKQYARTIQELRQKQRQLYKIRSPKEKQPKQKVKQQKSRQETKKMGNDYLKQLLQTNKKFAATKRFNKLEIIPQSPKRKIKSQYEIQIIKEERIQKIHKIKAKKIDGIVNDKSLDNETKYQKLKHETERLDQIAYAKLKDNQKIQEINQSASMMVNSINAKIAMLAFNSSKKF